MKAIKRAFAALCLLFIAAPTARAAFEDVLTEELKTDKGLFFACISEFEEGEKLITASSAENAVTVRAYDREDGTVLDDEITFAMGRKNEYALSVANYEHAARLAIVTNSCREEYTIREGAFTKAKVKENDCSETEIAVCRNGRINRLTNTADDIYLLAAALKEERLAKYNFPDKSVSNEEMSEIRKTIAAAADVMHFDARNYDGEKLMRYILNTGKNFEIITPLSSGIEEGAGDNINLAKKEYIDYIAKNIFGIIPPHAYVNELLTKGYCLNNEYYCYRPAFNVYFSTRIEDIKGIYDVGNGVDYVVFRDIYTEKSNSVSEYSYILLKDEGEYKRILMLGMGEALPDENDIADCVHRDSLKQDFFHF